MSAFLADLELGINVNREKGGRSPGRLVTLVRRMSTLCFMIQAAYGPRKTLESLTEREILELFARIRSGEQEGKRGRLKDVASYAESLAQWWRWHVEKNRKAGVIIPDNVVSLDTRNDYKPSWVYLTEEELAALAEHCTPDYKTLLWFAIDSGARPQEIRALRVSDISKDPDGVTWCDLRHEIAKKGSFGRRFKLLVCNRYLWEYIKRHGLKGSAFLFPQRVEAIKRYLKKRAVRLWGDAVSKGRDAYKNISLYDFRHCAAVYWRQRYKSINAYMYRMGWKDPSRAYYYDEFLGHKDTLDEDDLLTTATTPKLERELNAERNKRHLLEEQIDELNKRLELLELSALCGRISPDRVTADAPKDPLKAKSNRIKKQ